MLLGGSKSRGFGLASGEEAPGVDECNGDVTPIGVTFPGARVRFDG